MLATDNEDGDGVAVFGRGRFRGLVWRTSFLAEAAGRGRSLIWRGRRSRSFDAIHGVLERTSEAIFL